MTTTLLRLFYEFFKTGLFAVGGGAATIPFLREISAKTGWFTYAQLADMIAVSESTPGAIGVNMASYVGFTTAGIAGCVVATLGLITPGIIVILIVAQFLKRFQASTLVQDVFYGLRPASAGLIAAACFEIARVSVLFLDRWQLTGQFASIFSLKHLLLAGALFWAIQKTKLHPVAYIGIAALVGVVFRFGQ